MAWIKLQQSLPRHPKLARLAHKLRIHPAQAAGHLSFLWLWTLEYSPSGDLSAFEPAEISAAAAWPNKDPEAFVTALIESKWLTEGKLVHDWKDHVGRLLEEREKDKSRKKADRINKSTQDSTGRPPDVHRTSDAIPPDGRRTATVEKSRVEKSRVEGDIPPPSESLVNGSEVPTEEDVMAFAAIFPGEMARGIPAGIPAGWVLNWYAWRSSSERPFPKDWRSDLIRRFKADWINGIKSARPKATEPNGAQKPTLPAWKRIKELESEIENHPGNPANGIGSAERKAHARPAWEEKLKELAAARAGG